MNKILLLDAGNTTVTAAVGSGRRVKRLGSIASSSVSEKDLRRLLDSYPDEIQGAMLCSVVPALDRLLRRETKKRVAGPVLNLVHDLKLNFRIDYPEPATIGPDRIANLCGVYEKRCGAAIVCDFGTALTVDAVTRDGVFRGGVIAPGPALFAGYLSGNTARLPAVEMKRTSRGIGRSTAEAVQIGTARGYGALVGALVGGVRRDLGLSRAPVYITGGSGREAMRVLDFKSVYDADLTLRGLMTIYKLNVNGESQ